jgi:RNA-directed DNA polymerase
MRKEKAMYITFKRDDLKKIVDENFLNLFQNWEDTSKTSINTSLPPPRTYTRFVENPDPDYYTKKYNFTQMRTDILRNKLYVEQFATEDLTQHYESFHIPKRSGGLRRIDAPKPEMLTYLRNTKNLFEHKLHVLAHDAAFAYVRGRSTVHALQRHQNNESRWFLKLDIKDFFPSCNLSFILQQLHQIFPFNFLQQDSLINEALTNLIKTGLLNGSLPQGSPLSPLLTNIIMVPVDYTIQKTFRNWNKQHFIYTRYADDLLISSRYHFNWQEAQEQIEEIFKTLNTPFVINREKTRYGSSAGRNWNLGLMLNKDNQITIGHKRKERMRATLFTFFQDLYNGRVWDKIDVQVLLGNLSYFKQIEPQYVDKLITKYSTKFKTDFYQTAKQIIRDA